jgi:DNA primase
MANCRSDTAGKIRQMLTAREVAERYGFSPDRHGFIQCPFHAGDRHGSLKLYEGSGGFHCFGCGAGGSVIDFTMRLYGITFRQAVVRLNSDFGLGLTDDRPAPPSAEQLALARERAKEKKIKNAVSAAYPIVAAEYRRCHEITKYFPPSYAGGRVLVRQEYADAVKKMPMLEDWLERFRGR